MNTLLAAGSGDHFPIFTVFAVFVACTLFFSVAAVGLDSLSNYYLGHRKLSWAGNGLAIFGCFMSAAGLVSNPGLVSLTGFDGILYALTSTAGWRYPADLRGRENPVVPDDRG